MMDDLTTIFPIHSLFCDHLILFIIFFFPQPILWSPYTYKNWTIQELLIKLHSWNSWTLHNIGRYPMTCTIASNLSILIIKKTAKAIILRGGVNHTIQYWYSVLWYYPDMYQLSGTKCSSSGDACFAGLSHFPKFSVCFGSRSNCPHCRFCC